MGFSKKVLVLAVLGLSANATQVMHRPDDFKTKLQPNTVHNQTHRSLEERATGKIHGAYFTNWYVSLVRFRYSRMLTRYAGQIGASTEGDTVSGNLYK